MIGKLLNNWANRLDPKFIIIEENTKKIHKCNSVMFLRLKSKELTANGIKHECVEKW